jgi:hypothetical protein
MCLAAPAPALAGGVVGLAATLALLGLVNGAVTGAMNAEASAIEAGTGVPMMVSFHAMFSLGGVAGAAAGGLAAGSGLGPLPHMALLGLAGTLATLSRRGTLGEGDPPPGGPRSAAPAPFVALPRGRPLAGLALVCFATMLGEGAVADWSAVHLATDLGAGPLAAGLGYALFAAGMTVARLSGDALRERLGEVRLVRGGALLAAGGLGLGLLLGHPLSAVLGFACFGLGVASIVPIACRRAEAVSHAPPGVGIAAVAGVGFTGFLAGPPLIGLAAEVTGLGAALGVVPVLALVVALVARGVLQAPRAAAPGTAGPG